MQTNREHEEFTIQAENALEDVVSLNHIKKSRFWSSMTFHGRMDIVLLILTKKYQISFWLDVVTGGGGEGGGNVKSTYIKDQLNLHMVMFVLGSATDVPYNLWRVTLQSRSGVSPSVFCSPHFDCKPFGARFIMYVCSAENKATQY